MVFHILGPCCSESKKTLNSEINSFVSDHCDELGSNGTDELEILSAHASADDVFFDSVIGHIEDIFVGENIIHNLCCVLFTTFELS